MGNGVRRVWRGIGIGGMLACLLSLGAGSASAFPFSPEQPTILSTTAAVGQTLQARHGRWPGHVTSYEDFWIRCRLPNEVCQTIGASGLSYTPTAADVGYALEIGEIAHYGTSSSQPAYSSQSNPVLSAAARHFKLVGPTGIPQFAYYLVEPAGRRPTARSWQMDSLTTEPVGEVIADVKPGQTIYFNSVNHPDELWSPSGPRMPSPEGIAGKPYHVTASTPKYVRVTLPGVAKPYHPELSAGELYVLGQLNRRRREIGVAPLRISRILDDVASAAARDEAVNHRFPDPYFYSLPGSFGWPSDNLQVVDAPLSNSSEVLAHWDGAYSGESTGLWYVIRTPAWAYAGIADGGGAWIIVLAGDCPASKDAVHVCGLTNITGM